MTKKTYADLTATTTVATTDLVATYAPPSGPLKKITAPNFFGAAPWAIRGVTPASDKLAYFTSASAAALTDLSAFGRTLIDDADAPAARTTLGLVIGTDVEAYNAQLAAIAANSTNGFWSRSGAATGNARAMTGTANQIGVTNGDGVSDAPTFALLGNPLALAGLTGAADKLAYFTGAAAMAVTNLVSQARSFLADPSSLYVNFLQAGTGATAVTAQDKFRKAPVNPEEFGLFTNATVTTATLLACFTAAMADGRSVELSGNYTINGPITPTGVVDGAELHIILRDEVTITVAGGSTAFNRVFFAESTTITSHSISGGGTMTIDCNNLAAAGIWLRHTEAATGGTVFITSSVKVKNVYAVSAYSVAVGVIVAGRYEHIVCQSVIVEDVSRQLAGGESSGFTLSGFDGEVEMYSPVVRRIGVGAGTADADGIKCFGRQSGTTNNRREGSVRIYDPVFEDCQGRSYKDQCGNSMVFNPTVKRRASVMVAAANAIEFDFQFGGGIVLDAQIEYYKSGATSPLAASHSVAAFQQLVDNSEMYGAIRNTTIITDVEIPRYALIAEGGSASTTEIDGLTILPVNGFVATAIGRGIMEFDASQVGAKTTETTLSVKNFSGPNTNPCIAYTGYAALDSGTATAGGATTLTDGGKAWTVNAQAGREVRITSGTGSGQARTISSNTATVLTVSTAWGTNPDATSVYTIAYSMADKLTVKVNDCSTTMPVTGQATRAISDISGNQIVRFKAFEIGDNPGFRNYYSGWNFDVRNLRAGTKLIVATAANLITNAPAWGSSADNGYIECMAISNYSTASSDTVCRAYKNNATTSPSAWFTQDGGANWGALN